MGKRKYTRLDNIAVPFVLLTALALVGGVLWMVVTWLLTCDWKVVVAVLWILLFVAASVYLGRPHEKETP